MVTAADLPHTAVRCSFATSGPRWSCTTMIATEVVTPRAMPGASDAASAAMLQSMSHDFRRSVTCRTFSFITSPPIRPTQPESNSPRWAVRDENVRRAPAITDASLSMNRWSAPLPPNAMPSSRLRCSVSRCHVWWVGENCTVHGVTRSANNTPGSRDGSLSNQRINEGTRRPAVASSTTCGSVAVSTTRSASVGSVR